MSKRLPRHLLFGVAVLGSVEGAATAQVEIRFQEGTTSALIGGAEANAGDLDGDGIDDLLVGSPSYGAKGGTYVYSGASGSLIRTHDGPTNGYLFGSALDGVGDLDGDGIGDYVIGDPGGASGSGLAIAFSGATGQELWTWTGFLTWNFGRSISRVGDLDGDGRHEVLVGSNHGVVEVLSSTGVVLYSVVGQNSLSFGESLAPAGDVDGDGVPDFTAGDWRYLDPARGFIESGRVQVVSGATGLVISESLGLSHMSRYGWAVARCGDLDGDGIDDVVAGAPHEDLGAGANSGMVRVVSSVSGAEIFRQGGAATSDLLGESVAGCGDVDLDGVPDFLVGAIGAGNGAVLLESGATGTMLWQTDGAVTGFFGESLAVGNYDGDDVSDWVVGQPGYYDSALSTTTGAIYTYAGCPPRRSSYGSGWPGTLGTPSLDCPSGLAIGATGDVVVGNSTNAATFGLVLLGFSDASISRPRGGTLLVDARWWIPIAIPGASCDLLVNVPDDASLCFLELFVQGLEADAGAVGGISFTDGLELTIGLDL